LQLELQRKLSEQRNEIGEQIRKQEAEKSHLKETEHLLKQKELENN